MDTPKDPSASDARLEATIAYCLNQAAVCFEEGKRSKAYLYAAMARMYALARSPAQIASQQRADNAHLALLQMEI